MPSSATIEVPIDRKPSKIALVSVSAEIPVDLQEFYQNLAARNESSVSRQVRIALKDWAARNGKAKA
jgi:hypothetical protein